MVEEATVAIGGSQHGSTAAATGGTHPNTPHRKASGGMAQSAGGISGGKKLAAEGPHPRGTCGVIGPGMTEPASRRLRDDR